MTVAAWSALMSDPLIDSSWAEAAALLVIDPNMLYLRSEHLTRIRAELIQVAAGAQAEVAAQLRLVIVQFDPLIGWSRSYERAAVIGARRTIVEALAEAGGSAFTDQLEVSTGMRPRDISEACEQLADAGLVIGRTFGGRREWTLTPLMDLRSGMTPWSEEAPDEARVSEAELTYQELLAAYARADMQPPAWIVERDPARAFSEPSGSDSRSSDEGGLQRARHDD